MRFRRAAAAFVILMCLPATAWASNWTGGSANWENGGSWSAGVPDGTSAYIGNGGNPTLDTNVAGITTLNVAWFSTLEIETGAGLTASGNASVAGGGSDWGTVTQSGGVVSLQSNLSIATGNDDSATWTMTGDGALAVGSDLTIGGSGDGQFYLGDNSSLTVGGNINIASGKLTVSGGALGQPAGGGNPAILADVVVNGASSLQVEGNASTMNVATYDQANSASLRLVLDNAGIATVNVDGNITLGGELNVSIAGNDVPAPGVYDILVAKNGAITGEFTTYAMDRAQFKIRYETNDDGDDSVRLYVGVEAPALTILGDLPADRYDKIISVNIKGVDDYDVSNGAGAVAADNWNNLVYSSGDGTKVYGPAQLVDDSGVGAVSMSVTQNSSAPISNSHNPWGALLPTCANATVLGVPSDPNIDLYGSQAPAAGWCAEHLPPFSHGISSADTKLRDLNVEFANGYDLIVNVAKWSQGTAGSPAEYVVVRKDSGATQIGNLEMDLQPVAYKQAVGFEEGVNYVILRDLRWDTLDLDLNALAPNDWGQAQSMQITGVQLLGLAPASKEIIVDNQDFPLAEKVWLWLERGTSDEWDGSSFYTTDDSDIDGTTPGHQGNWFRWNTPVMPFAAVTEYEVFVWYSSARPDPDDGYYNSDSMAEYTVHYAGGVSDPIIIDQNVDSGTWVSLGFFPFSGESTDEYVQLTRTPNATGTTSADAVRWLWTLPAAQEPVVPEPAGLGLIGLSLLALKKRRR